MERSQQPTPSPTSGMPSSPTAAFALDTSLNPPAHTTSFEPPPTFDFAHPVHVQPSLPGNALHMDTAPDGRLDRNLAQERRLQTQWQHKARLGLQMRQQQQQQEQRSNMRQQRYDHPVQGNALTQHHQLTRQRQISDTQIQQYYMQHVRQQTDLPASHVTPLPPTPQPTPKQSPSRHSAALASVMADYPQLQRSMATGLINTTDQFAQPPVTAQHPKKAAFQVGPQVASARRNATSQARPNPETPSFTTNPRADITASDRSRRENSAATWEERARRNEAAEYLRLENAHKHEIERREKKLREVQDPNAIYYNYREVLEYFPLRRGERPSPYLLGLLANQIVPEGELDDRALAIKFAKKHWEFFWELKDLTFVIKEEKEARDQHDGSVSVTYRR